MLNTKKRKIIDCNNWANTSTSCYWLYHPFTPKNTFIHLISVKYNLCFVIYIIHILDVVHYYSHPSYTTFPYRYTILAYYILASLLEQKMCIVSSQRDLFFKKWQ